MQKILLITHDTSLTGAPKSILLVFEQLALKGYQITTIALKSGGKLTNGFKKISTKYYCLDEFSKQKNYTVINRIKNKFGIPFISEYDCFLEEIARESYDYIYANTIISLEIGLEFKNILKAKLILHVHELATVINEFAPDFNLNDKHVDAYIVPSDLNKKCLIEEFSILERKIYLIRETSDQSASILKKPSDSPYINVLMCGGAYWRKGDDLFILIANNILKKDNKFRFYWLGQQSSERKRVNEADIVKLGLKDYVFFLNESDRPSDYYLKSDIFLLTSREDPFPLAAIDAGILGMPIFCFDKATGIAEVVDSSFVVPYLDVEEMANRILAFTHILKKDTFFSRENAEIFKSFSPDSISCDIESLLIAIR